MPIAESELVTGYMTEYSGLRFLLFFIGEFAVGRRASPPSPPRCSSAAGTCPGLDIDADYMNVVGPLVLLGEDACSSAASIFWVRFTYPRFREDQLQRFAWTVLIPIVAGQHPGHHGPEGGVLMPHPKGARPSASSRGSASRFDEIVKTMFPEAGR